MNLGLISLSMLAGFLTVLSPCILPILPALLGASATSGLRHRPFWIVLGLAASFTLFVTVFTLFGTFLGLSNELLRQIALVILFLLGLSLLWPRLIETITSRLSDLGQRATGIASLAPEGGRLNAIVIGGSLGLIWAPCAGPILGVIITLAVVQQSFHQTLLLMAGYALGAALPMLMIGYGGQKFFRSFQGLRSWGAAAPKVLGVLTLASVAVFALNLETVLLSRLPQQLFVFSQIEERLVGEQVTATSQQHPPGGRVEAASDRPAMLTVGEQRVELPVLGVMPEFAGIDAWLNSPPLTSSELRGKVVLIDFWTYSCINCIRTLPHVTQWYEKYKDQGFVIVGVHTPEFAFEKSESNVRQAIRRHEIRHPVALDNDYETWNAYSNRYWPAHYLIDAQGRIRYTHFGEGEYDRTEQAIQTLLEEADLLRKRITVGSSGPDVDFSRIHSPETYIGYDRAENFVSMPSLQPGVVQDYMAPQGLKLNQWALSGTWRVTPESAQLEQPAGGIRYRFRAPAVNLVMSGNGNRARVLLDGAPLPPAARGRDVGSDGSVTIGDARLYNLVRLPPGDDGQHLFELVVDEPGAMLFAFTFG